MSTTVLSALDALEAMAKPEMTLAEARALIVRLVAHAMSLEATKSEWFALLLDASREKEAAEERLAHVLAHLRALAA